MRSRVSSDTLCDLSEPRRDWSLQILDALVSQSDFLKSISFCNSSYYLKNMGGARQGIAIFPVFPL